MGTTIEDFGDQWQIHGNLGKGHWTSTSMFNDHFKDNTPPFQSLKGKIVAEVGAGSGRILRMLSKYNPKKLYGIEPSSGFAILESNTQDLKNIYLQRSTGEEFRLPEQADYIFSLGVIHHIEDPTPVVANIHKQLKLGGMFILWVYGYENQKLYVIFQILFRPIIRLLPDAFLNVFSKILTYFIDSYALLSKFVFRNRLPMSSYLFANYMLCSREQKKYIIFDQLNPSFSKYYKRHEVEDLLRNSGFSRIELYHRHKYSWTAIALK